MNLAEGDDHVPKTLTNTEPQRKPKIPDSLSIALKNGGPVVWASCLIMGLANILNGQLIMGLIYLAVTVVGVQSRGLFEPAANGGVALAQIARHYLGSAGLLVLAATVTLACLKTAVGLITSCAETFSALFPNGPAYRIWAIIFSAISFLFANLGLSAIIDYSIPVLMFLYPLAIVLILLALFGKFFRHDRVVYISTIALTFVAALYDLLRTLPEYLRTLCHLDAPLEAVGNVLPLASLGLGWVCPAALGLVIGLVIHFLRKQPEAA